MDAIVPVLVMEQTHMMDHEMENAKCKQGKSNKG
jgi:hypothetical protein